MAQARLVNKATYVPAGTGVECEIAVDQNTGRVLVDVISAPSPTSTGTPSLDVSFGTLVTHITKASAGNVFSIAASNANAALRFFQIFNRSTALAGGETPIYSIPLPAGSATAPSVLVFDNTFFTEAGHNFATGITWGFSTTVATYTAATAADHTAHVHFI